MQIRVVFQGALLGLWFCFFAASFCVSNGETIEVTGEQAAPKAFSELQGAEAAPVLEEKPFLKKPIFHPLPKFKKPLSPPVPVYKKPLPPPKKPLPPTKKPLPPPVPVYKKPFPPPIFKKPFPPPPGKPSPPTVP